jgi:hypothetical protein
MKLISTIFSKKLFMSRLDELKKQYPELNVTMFDVFKAMDPTSSYKYFPLLCKIFSKRWRITEQYPKDEAPKVIMEYKTLLTSLGINTEGFGENQNYFLRHLMDFYPNNHFETLKEFMSLVENKRVENTDVTSYNSIDDIRSAVSLASIKELNRDLEGQVIKEFEDDKWVIVRPLTFASSVKYGASTRWCTTYKTDKAYFERYWRQGILVYFINKLTGYKFAGYKSLSEHDLSFWNAEDQRVDYLDIDVDEYIFPIVRRIFKSKDTNKNLCSDELQEKVHQECLEGMENKLRVVEPLVEVVPRAYAEEDLRTVTPQMTWTTTSTEYEGFTEPSPQFDED